MIVRWAEYVARTFEIINAYKNWLWNLYGRNHAGEINVDGKIILKWIIEK
jgi:hypothetical protein